MFKKSQPVRSRKFRWGLSLGIFFATGILSFIGAETPKASGPGPVVE